MGWRSFRSLPDLGTAPALIRRRRRTILGSRIRITKETAPMDFEWNDDARLLAETARRS